MEIQYISKVFHAIYRKFLTDIDDIDYHPPQIQNTTRVKRSEEYDLHGYYCSYIRTLTSSKEIFLDKFLMALHKVNPSLHKHLSQMKRVGILMWILGWSVYSNARSILKIKDNLHTLQKQNQLQDEPNPWGLSMLVLQQAGIKYTYYHSCRTLHTVRKEKGG